MKRILSLALALMMLFAFAASAQSVQDALGAASAMSNEELYEKAKAEVERMKTDNDRSAMKTFQDFIVDPLKGEIKRLNRNINGLQKAIRQANSCPHSDDCPVLDELQNQSDSECGAGKRDQE